MQKALSSLNYSIYFQVFDAKYFTPQLRERIFIIGFAHEHFMSKSDYVFPIPHQNGPVLSGLY